DNTDFGGLGNVDETVSHFTTTDPLYTPHNLAWLKLYLPARTAQVFRQVDYVAPIKKKAATTKTKTTKATKTAKTTATKAATKTSAKTSSTAKKTAKK
ncbi:MAG: hypothetical protein K2M05_00980, partial [Paramuribaculum sp.]|nr:hypothetical protein [Paramuribaculum sp.]